MPRSVDGSIAPPTHLGRAILTVLLLTATIAEADHLVGLDPLLAGGDFSHTDHGGHIHSGESLAGIILVDAGLVSTTLTGSDLTGANLANADLTRAVLGAANLTNADLTRADIRGANLTNAILSDANLSAVWGLSDTQLQAALDLTGVDLSGRDFWTFDFSGLNLSGANLSGAILAQATVTGANFSGADLSNVNMRLVVGLVDTQLRPAASLVGIDLSYVNMYGFNLDSLDLTGATLVHTNLIRARMHSVVLTNANLTSAHLDRANMNESNLAGANFTDASVDASMNGANVTGADFTNADLGGASMWRAIGLTDTQLQAASSVARISLYELDLSGFDFSGLDLSNAIGVTDTQLQSALSVAEIDLSDVDLAGADLSGLDLSRSNLSGANLTAVNFSGVDLTDANLSGALGLQGSSLQAALSLRGIDLSAVDLSGSNLSGSDLTNADLTGTIMAGVDLTNANLFGVVGLSEMQILGVTSLVGANLAGADFRGFDLAEVDFTSVNLMGVDLRDANLSDVLALPLAFFDTSTWYNRATRLPQGFEPEAFSWTLLGHSNLYADATQIVNSIDLVPNRPGSGWVYGDGLTGGLSMNDSGDVAFRHFSRRHSFSLGIFLDVGGTDHPIASVGDPAPNTAGVYSYVHVGKPSLNNSGDVAFWIGTTDLLIPQGIFINSGGVDSAVALVLDVAPDTGGGHLPVFRTLSVDQLVGHGLVRGEFHHGRRHRRVRGVHRLGRPALCDLPGRRSCADDRRRNLAADQRRNLRLSGLVPIHQ